MKSENSTKEKKKTVIFIIVAVILVLLSSLITAVIHSPISTITTQLVTGLHVDENTSNSYEDVVSNLANRNVYFAGISDTTISSNTKIYLENLAENEDIYMKYIITDADTNEIVFETDLIQSDTHVEWIAAEDLRYGENHLIFSEAPYFPVEGGYVPLTVGQNKVTLTVVR